MASAACMRLTDFTKVKTIFSLRCSGKKNKKWVGRCFYQNTVYAVQLIMMRWWEMMLCCCCRCCSWQTCHDSTSYFPADVRHYRPAIYTVPVCDCLDAVYVVMRRPSVDHCIDPLFACMWSCRLFVIFCSSPAILMFTLSINKKAEPSERVGITSSKHVINVIKLLMIISRRLLHYTAPYRTYQRQSVSNGMENSEMENWVMGKMGHHFWMGHMSHGLLMK